MSNLVLCDDCHLHKRIHTAEDLLYRLARLARNTDGLHPSTSGQLIGSLLSQLRIMDNERYDREVMAIKDDPVDATIHFMHALNNPDASVNEIIEKGAACGFNVRFELDEKVYISRNCESCSCQYGSLLRD